MKIFKIKLKSNSVKGRATPSHATKKMASPFYFPLPPLRGGRAPVGRECPPPPPPRRGGSGKDNADAIFFVAREGVALPLNEFDFNDFDFNHLTLKGIKNVNTCRENRGN
jgi:hypothetical protein